MALLFLAQYSIILFALRSFPHQPMPKTLGDSAALGHLDVLVLAIRRLLLGTLSLGTLLLILLLHGTDRSQEVIRHCRLVVEESEIEGNVVPLICQRRGCTLLHKQLDYVEMSAQGCPVETRVAVLVCLVQEGLLLLLWPVVKVLDELSDDFYRIVS